MTSKEDKVEGRIALGEMLVLHWRERFLGQLAWLSYCFALERREARWKAVLLPSSPTTFMKPLEDSLTLYVESYQFLRLIT